MGHTKGEWKIVSKKYDRGLYHIHSESQNCKVVEIHRGGHPVKDFLERAKADAQLISAAPDMFEALEELYDHSARLFKMLSEKQKNQVMRRGKEIWDEHKNRMIKAEKALQKAKGEDNEN